MLCVLHSSKQHLNVRAQKKAAEQQRARDETAKRRAKEQERQRKIENLLPHMRYCGVINPTVEGAKSETSGCLLFWGEL